MSTARLAAMPSCHTFIGVRSQPQAPSCAPPIRPNASTARSSGEPKWSAYFPMRPFVAELVKWVQYCTVDNRGNSFGRARGRRDGAHSGNPDRGKQAPLAATCRQIQNCIPDFAKIHWARPPTFAGEAVSMSTQIECRGRGFEHWLKRAEASSPSAIASRVIRPLGRRAGRVYQRARRTRQRTLDRSSLAGRG